MGYALWPLVGLVAAFLAWNGWRYYVRAVHGVDPKKLARLSERMDLIEAAAIEAAHARKRLEDQAGRHEKTLAASVGPRPVPSFGAQRLHRG